MTAQPSHRRGGVEPADERPESEVCERCGGTGDARSNPLRGGYGDCPACGGTGEVQPSGGAGGGDCFDHWRRCDDRHEDGRVRSTCSCGWHGKWREPGGWPLRDFDRHLALERRHARWAAIDARPCSCPPLNGHAFMDDGRCSGCGGTWVGTDRG